MEDKGIIRQVGEDLLEYQIRIMSNKDLYNLTWDEVGDILNKETNENWTSGKYRKWWSFFKQGVDYAEYKHINNLDKDIVQRIEEKEQELYKVKIKASDQKRENNNLLKRIARAEHLIDTIENAIQGLNESQPLVLRNFPKGQGQENKEGLVLFSDWHYGLETNNYWNVYNKKIFTQRIRKLTQKIIEYGKEQKIKTLHVFLLGDLVNGLIHVQTRISNEEDVITQTMEVSEILANVITELANSFDEVKVYNTLDNHGRVNANKKDNLEVENFARLITWYLKPRLKQIPTIKFMENKYDLGIIDANICNYKVYGSHGHEDKIGDIVADLSLMTKEVPDYIVTGHIHHNASTETNEVEVIVNPSLSGVDDYAKTLRKTSKPAQKFLIFSSEEGLLNTYSIRLDK